MEPWQPTQSEGELNLLAANRLFTRQDKDEQYIPVAIDSSVDPHGSLARLAGSQYVHTEDNVVRYFARAINGDGSIR